MFLSSEHYVLNGQITDVRLGFVEAGGCEGLTLYVEVKTELGGRHAFPNYWLDEVKGKYVRCIMHGSRETNAFSRLVGIGNIIADDYILPSQFFDDPYPKLEGGGGDA